MVIRMLGSTRLMGIDAVLLLLAGIYFIGAVRGHGRLAKRVEQSDDSERTLTL
jgi:hypothetical protein